MLIRKRAITILIVIMLLFLGLISRLIQIQLVSTESFTKDDINLLEASVSQRTQEFVIDQGRGRFIDRNGEALTHEYYPTLVLFPFLKNIEWPIDKVAAIINTTPEQIIESLDNKEKPVVFGGKEPIELTETQMNKINGLQIPGVFAVHYQYELDSKIAEHLIGLIRENPKLFEERYPEKNYLSRNTKLGITGLQSTFDEFLLPEGEAKLLYHVAGNGGPLFGIDVKYTAPANPYYPVVVQTTLNKDFQIMAEELTEQYGLKKGGVILLDIETNDLLAIVSKPHMKGSDPFSDESAENQMLMPQFPGSVFKPVVAVAAIEYNIVSNNRTFDCDLDLYGEGKAVFSFGVLNFKDSFAKSCNYTFATLAQELMEKNANILEEYADRLGLLGPVSWHGDVFRYQDFRQLPNEYPGRIWKDERDKSVKKAIAQTSIGQKDVRVTPLGIANMISTIARGGEKKQVRTVSNVLYKNGTTLFSFPENEMEGEKIAPYTASVLQELLREVVVSGSGKRFASLPYKVAGKSGTAETGKFKGDTSLLNKWFAGYFPMKKPKYALVVVELEATGGHEVIRNIYSDFVHKIYEYDQGKR